MSKTEKINIQVHPRAFAAFGEDLVTNDVVAIIELVKNSYDAYAFETKIKFGSDSDGEFYISILDNGLGMNKKTILDAWATIATPYKKKHPTITRIVNGEEKVRQVSGNKGLGRFSAARLGDEMIMYTKSRNGKTLKAFFNWKSFENVNEISECVMTLDEVEDNIFDECGTKIVIRKLKSEWNEDKINELEEELSRLINPFKNISDFSIEMSSQYNKKSKVEPNKFIENPVYKISGSVDQKGNIHYTYIFENGQQNRESKNQIIEWVVQNYKDNKRLLLNKQLQQYKAGPFEFEFRVWDLDSDSIQEVSERFDISKGNIRKNIKLYKGISVYRDNILVLPKSETTRDWLGLDQKRISQIGKRISTSQIIGIVYITNKENPQIKDTTDREKLADTLEYEQFAETLTNIIEALQRERRIDKIEDGKKDTLTDIIAPLSAEQLLMDVELAVENGAQTEEVVEYIKSYHEKNEEQLKVLNDRLVYYAQTASLGSVAIVIMHEFLTGMTSIKRFLNKVKTYVDSFDTRTKSYLCDAELSHQRIVEVSESFAPLYRRDLRKRINKSFLSETINKSISLIKAKKTSKYVRFCNSIKENIVVEINESELQTIFINLMDNACYWMKDTPNAEKQILIELESSDENKVVLAVSDSGCGILEENVDKIFLPGVTSKPKGIGMGLVIVTEIVKGNGGEVAVRFPAELGGATFIIELQRGK